MGYIYVDGNWDIYMWKMNENLEDDTLYTQSMTYDSLCPYQITSDTVDLDCGLFVNVDEIPTKEEYESTIKISPNPAINWVVLTLPENILNTKIDLAVYNIFGQSVMQKAAIPVDRKIALNLTSLSQGIYIVFIKAQSDKIIRGKFIVEK